MSRKHYNDMARRFGIVLAAPRIRGNSAAARAAWECINTYIEHAAADNPRFDADYFTLTVRVVRDAYMAESQPRDVYGDPVGEMDAFIDTPTGDTES